MAKTKSKKPEEGMIGRKGSLVRIKAELYEKLQAEADAARRPVTTQLEIALEERYAQ